MRYLLTLTCLLAFMLNACKKSGENALVTFNGNYKGTYQKLGPTYQMPQTANITLAFSADKWSGNTDTNGYPGLCNGTFTVKGNKVTFMNACNWVQVNMPGDILDGEFTISKTGALITLVQTRGNTTNTYQLARQ